MALDRRQAGRATPPRSRSFGTLAPDAVGVPVFWRVRRRVGDGGGATLVALSLIHI